MIQISSEEHYRDEAGCQYYTSLQEVPENVYRLISRHRAEKLMPYISERDVVLEYGVGSGWNLSELTCAKKMGFDIGGHLQPIVSAHGIKFIADTKSISDKSVDVIVCHHVLEHVPSPSETLLELWRMLKPSGQLLLFVPFETQRRHRQFIEGEPNQHIFSWTPQTIGNLVSDCQFDIQSINLASCGYDRAFALYADKYKLGENVYRFLKMVASQALQVKEIQLVAMPRS